MGEVIVERLQPYLEGEKTPKVKRFFFVAAEGSIFLGARAENPTRMKSTSWSAW